MSYSDESTNTALRCTVPNVEGPWPASTDYWLDKRVVVTGGGGFLGSNVVKFVRARGCRDVFVPRSRDYDLRREAAVVRLFADSRPDVVIHLAAVVGGIGSNRLNPGRFFYENLMMGVQLMEQARLAAVQKFVSIGTVCSYPNMRQCRSGRTICGTDTR